MTRICNSVFGRVTRHRSDARDSPQAGVRRRFDRAFAEQSGRLAIRTTPQRCRFISYRLPGNGPCARPQRWGRRGQGDHRSSRRLHPPQPEPRRWVYVPTHGRSEPFPLTAAAVVALYNAGIYESSEIDAAIKYLQDNFASCSSLQKKHSFTMRITTRCRRFGIAGVIHGNNGTSVLRRILLQLRTDKLGWFDFYSSEYGTAMACLILNMPRTVLPIFQR